MFPSGIYPPLGLEFLTSFEMLGVILANAIYCFRCRIALWIYETLWDYTVRLFLVFELAMKDTRHQGAPALIFDLFPHLTSPISLHEARGTANPFKNELFAVPDTLALCGLFDTYSDIAEKPAQNKAH